MALATRCPHCHTTFRVAADQLKLRGGIVRCGTCHEVFDGNAALIDLAAPAPPVAAPEVQAPAAQLAVDAVPVDAAHEDDFAPAPVPDPAPAAPFDHLPVDEELVAAPLPDDEALAAPAPAGAERQAILRTPSSPPRQSAGIAYSPDAAMQARLNGKKGKRKTAPVPAAGKPKARPRPRPADADEPEFVKLGRAKEARHPIRTRLMAAGCVLLALLLVGQLFMASRDLLVARYPGLHPVAGSLCAAFGCRIALPAQIDTLAVETGELQTLGNGAFTYTTLLRNQGTLVQAWPSLELTLIDPNDKPLVRRVFAPRDYLTPVVGAGGFAGRTEQSVKLSFQLADLKPSGYHIAIFYP